jgi:hypothetical protein
MKKLISGRTKYILFSLFIFLVVTLVYFSPMLEGKRMVGSDTVHFIGMSKEIVDFRSDTGEEALWTSNLFSGMPAYLISTRYPGNFLTYLILGLENIPRPIIDLLKNFSFFLVLLLVLGVNPWISFVGALSFGLSTAFFVWIDTGHMSKAETLTYMALLIAGILYAYRKNAVVGSMLAAVGLSLMIFTNHPQITYYAGILTGIIGITYLVFAIKEKTFAKFIKTSAMLVLAAVLAVGVNFGRLYNIYEYGKFSMRGESELTPIDDNRTSGLDRDYILDYSYDAGEAVTAFIPRFKGGGMSEPIGENSNFYKELAKSQGAARARQIAQNAPLYWGSQPISGAPFYFGAVLIFLFVFGLFVVKGKDKWWVIAAVVISFLLSLGKNIPALAHFMIDYFPLYDKFRDVKNIIVIQHFSMAFLGVMAIKTIYERKLNDKDFYKKLKLAFGIAGGFALIFVLFPGLAGSFSGNTDARYLQMGWPHELIEALHDDRKAVLRADAFRTFIFVALAAASLWAYWTKKIKAQYAIVIWSILVIADMWPINKRYLNNDDFIPKRKTEVPFTPTAADLEILKDKDPNYRVLNMAVSTFNDASTSYFHKSVGGYHGAKMQRYQDFIDHHLSIEMQQLRDRLRNVQSQSELERLFDGFNGLNMLNTRYLIFNADASPLYNPMAMGNAWYVNGFNLVDNADQEIETVDEIDPFQTAIIDKNFEEYLPDQLSPDPSASIQLVSYEPNKLVYEATTDTEQLAVFSEVYYPKGWIAYVNGEEVPHFRANYIFRAMLVPAGNNEIVFEFKPKSYFVGNRISLIFSLILLLAIVATVIYEYKKQKALKGNEE